MLLFLNPNAAGGRALVKWRRAETEFHTQGFKATLLLMDGQETTQRAIIDALQNGEREFAAAGGDGTVNSLLNILLSVVTPEQRETVRFGALGLGSSNDFHKPFVRKDMVEGIPCKLGFRHAVARDVGCLVAATDAGFITRYFLVNASVGITAEANRFFNSPDPILQFLKRVSTSAAIAYSAFTTIARFTGFRATLCSAEHGSVTTTLSNLGIIKSPHCSGHFVYPSPAKYNDGTLQVYVSRDMNRWEILQFARSLIRSGRIPKTDRWSTTSLIVTAERPFAVEFDGEVISTSFAQFGILPRFLKVCP